METFTTYEIGPEQPTYTQLREQNRVLREALEQIAMSNEVWERDQMIDCAEAALTATSQPGGTHEL